MSEKKTSEKKATPCCCGGKPTTKVEPKCCPAPEGLEKKIKDFLEKEIKPALARDGGSCEYQGFKDGVVSLRLEGACKGCPGARFTLKMGIEARMKEVIPEVTEVEAV